MNTPTIKAPITPVDQHIRERALDTRRSFAVSAPAGSGKTGLLTQRVLALLAQCDEPENVLAITFTNKAAAEMQSRILEALLDAQANPNEPEEDYKKATWRLAKQVIARNDEKQWELFHCPNRLRITTIDSLCRSLSQQMPFESGLGSAPEILDNPNSAYQMAARDVIKLLDKENPLQADVQRLVKHCNNQLEQIEELFCKLLSKRDQWLPLIVGNVSDQRERLEHMLNELIEEQLYIAQQSLAPIASDLALLADHAASNLQDSSSPIKHCLGLSGLPPATAEAIPQWQGLANLLLTGDNIRKSPTANIGFIAPSKIKDPEQKATAKAYKEQMTALYEYCRSNPELHEAVTQTLHATQSLPNNTYPDAQWELLESLTRLLVMLNAYLNVAFQQLGKTDYLQITLAALDALGQSDAPSDLALTLDYKIQHILVDEFQDTSSTQLELLQRLTAGWQPNDGRTLFVVGDAMQSCYGFRDANVSIFLNVREHGLGDIAIEALDLEVNFRSQQGIVDWVNHSFSEILPAESDINRGAVSYKPSVSVKPTLGIAAVNTHLFTYEKQKPAIRSDEAEAVLRIVQDTQAQNPSDRIAILVRSKAHSRDIIATLAKANIQYQATDIDRLDTCMPVLDMLSLTKALLYPNDRTAWLSLLRAPWCGLNMSDLLHIAQYRNAEQQDRKQEHTKEGSNQKTPLPLLLHSLNNPDALTTLSDTGQAKIHRLMRVINPALAQQKRLSLRRWIQGIWYSLGGAGLLLNPNDSSNIITFFNLLDKYEHGGGIPQWDELEQAVTELYAKPLSQKNKHSDDTEQHRIPPVEIMTVHKSKGLEFDTVILPALDKKSGMNDKELMVWLERIGYSHRSHRQEQQLLISPVHAVGADNDPLYSFIKQQRKDKEKIEADRLLYVACTRAIKQLHLMGYVAADNNEDTDSNDSEALSIQAPIQALTQTLKEPSREVLLSRLWKTITQQLNPCYIQPVHTHSNAYYNDKFYHPNAIASLHTQWQAPNITANTVLQAYRGNNALANLDSTDNNIAKPDALLQREQRYIGIVIHQALEDICRTGYTHWNAQRIQQQHPIWRSQLSQLSQQGISPLSVDKSLATVAHAITQTLNDKTGQWLLDNTHQDSATELALWDKHGQHIIDRTFIEEKDGVKTRWIIDYKSSQPTAEENLEMFIETEKQQYQPQLERYKKLFKNEESQIRTALYFVLMQQLVEV